MRLLLVLLALLLVFLLVPLLDRGPDQGGGTPRKPLDSSPRRDVGETAELERPPRSAGTVGRGALRQEPATDLADGLARSPAAVREIRGVVLDRAGAPLPEVDVFAFDAGGERLDRDDSGRDGSFRLRLAGTMGEVELRVEGEGPSAGFVLPEPVQALVGDLDVRLVLTRGAAMVGSLFSDPDRGPERLRVRAWPEQAELDPMRHGVWNPGGYRRPRNGEIEADGTFRIEGLGAGPHEFQLAASDAPFFRIGGIQLTLGQESRDPRLQRINLSEVLRRLIVQVEQVSSKPIESARLFAFDPSGGLIAAPRESRPVFAIDVARGVPVDLLVIAEGYRPALRQSVRTDTTVVLEPGIRIGLLAQRPVVLEEGGRGAFLHLRPEFEAGPTLPAWHRDVPVPMQIGAGEEVALTVPGPGLYRLFVTVRSRMGTLYGSSERDVAVPTDRTVLITDADEGGHLYLDLPVDALSLDGREEFEE